MKKKLDFTLALVILALLTLAALVMSGGQLLAQEPIVLRMGTTMSEAQGTLTRLPYLTASESENSILVRNEFLAANYSFYRGELERINITREYTSGQVASAAIDGYLVYLGRINATVVPVIHEDRRTVYYAMTSDAHYELDLWAESKKVHIFTVRIQSRNLASGQPDQFEASWNAATEGHLVSAQWNLN